MTELLNLERLGDEQGAAEAIDVYLENFTNSPFATILRQRQQAYLHGAPPLAANKGLLGAYCNTSTRIFLDGKIIGEVNDPERMRFFDIDLPSGQHVLSVQAAWHPYPDWVQVALKTSEGILGTDASWKYAFNPTGNWAFPSFNDSTWKTHEGSWVKGPPEEPYLWCEPNPHVGMQSKARGLRPPEDWPQPGTGYVVYRKVFSIP